MWLIFILASIFSGSIILKLIDSKDIFKGPVRFFSFIVLGLSFLGLVTLVLAVISKDLNLAIILGVIISFSGTIIFAFKKKDDFWGSFKLISVIFKKSDILSYLILSGFCVLSLIILFQNLVFENGFPKVTLAGWGDTAYHLDIIKTLETSKPFELIQPIASDYPLTYPFLIDFLSAIFLKLGMSLEIAFHLPTSILLICLIFLVFYFGKQFLSKKYLTIIFVLLIFIGSGFGFYWFLKDVNSFSQTQNISYLESLKINFLNPKFEYTHMDETTGGKEESKNSPVNIVWITPLISFFSHQRSFILGAGLGFIFLIGFLSYSTKERFNFLIPLSFMPIVHSHSLLALLIFFASFIAFNFKEFNFKDKNYLKYFIKVGLVALIIALPQVIFLYQGIFSSSGNSFFALEFGWLACSHNNSQFLCDDLNFIESFLTALIFWIKNFGIIFILWLSFLFFKKQKQELKIYFPSLILFVLPNIIRFQSWPFDNNKILFWWWVLAIFLILFYFDKAFKKNETTNKSKAKNVLLVIGLIIFVLIASFSSIIDLRNRVVNRQVYGYYGEEEMALAGFINNNTKPNDVFLSNYYADQFIPMLTGRKIYLGYTGWLWSQGNGEEIDRRNKVINEFLNTKDPKILCQEGINYWLKDKKFFDDYQGVDEGFENAGEVVFSLNSPYYGKREIIKLNCPNL